MANESENSLDARRDQLLREVLVEFGRRVRELRKAAGLTQTELAERLGHWGRSYHQTTVAKLEAGIRPTTLDELLPLGIALSVSEREFFDDPSPTDRAEHKVREAEQGLLETHSDLMDALARVKQLQQKLQWRVHLHSIRVTALAELDSEAAAERQQEADALEDLAKTLLTDQWPGS